MKLLYLDAQGHAYAEDLHPKYALVEHHDGYHAGPGLVKDAVYIDRGRLYPALYILWQGSTYPEGTPVQRDYLEDYALIEAVKKQMMMSIPTSRLLWRQIVRWLLFAGQLVYSIFALTVVAFFILLGVMLI